MVTNKALMPIFLVLALMVGVFNSAGFAVSDPLLSEASLYLKASSLNTNWVEADSWFNEGSAGAVLNPIFGDSGSLTTIKSGAFYSPTAPGSGAGIFDPFVNPDPTIYNSNYGFYIPNSSYFEIPDTGGITITFDITPENVNHTSKVAFSYPMSDLPTSKSGWVVENVLGIGVGPMITAGNDGSQYGAALYQRMVPERHRITVRIDRDSNKWTFFRDGVKLSQTDISSLGSLIGGAPLYFGVGYTYHNTVIQNRALSDSEIAKLNGLLVQDSCEQNMVIDCDSDEDGTKDSIEDAGPNGGDANNDGIKDKYQINVTTILAADGPTYATLVAPNETRVKFFKSDSLGADSKYQYPFGSFSYSLDADSGNKYNVDLIIHTTQDKDGFVVNSNGAPMVEPYDTAYLEIGGKRATKLSYSFQDGGYNDYDVTKGLISFNLQLASLATPQQVSANVSIGIVGNSGLLAESGSDELIVGEIGGMGLLMALSLWFIIRLQRSVHKRRHIF